MIDYMKKTREERRQHLKLDDSCREIGGFSFQFAGILAIHLNTRIPKRGQRVLVCHACHNAECSNPNHLYWGTGKDNHLDAVENGTFKNFWENRVAKHGHEKACKMNARSSESASKSGKGNKGTTKSEEHKKKISEGLRKAHQKRKETSLPL